MGHFDFDIFFSFASLDKAEARPLYEQLTASGLRVFWSDESLQESIGESWYNEIAEALQSSRHFVLLWTEASAKSKFCGVGVFAVSCLNDPGKKDRYLVPVLGARCASGYLAFFTWQLPVLLHRERTYNACQETRRKCGGLCQSGKYLTPWLKNRLRYPPHLMR